ncbi:hypothetical protein GCM10012275_41370 [Longimycelium tulufanense]|uniref:Uncharacterized protein n=1 Tax=Longimycelium tulufanense TaxID=907463 RepID=A0A8J3FVV0_9PSEU|nr:hypothetical protein [Longimycelium tulufanense]GGM66578.1 hypothetical protein GCM10012275_41370 [Longimycelium tulufanense]
MRRSLILGALMSLLLGLFAATSTAAATPGGVAAPAGWTKVTEPADVPAGVTLYSVANGRYVSTELGYSGADYAMLRARALMASRWEQFRLEFRHGATVIKSRANGRYVSVETGYRGGNYAMLRAKSHRIGITEKFTLYYQPGTGSFAFQSWANGRFVTTELRYTGADYAMLRAWAVKIGPRERFVL